MPRDYRLYLEDIVEEIQHIDQFIAGQTFESFQADVQLMYAVLHALTVIGEAAGNIPVAIREQYPAVDWQGFRGLRNVITHQYPNIRLERLWEVIEHELPDLAVTVEAILADVEGR